MQKENTPSPEGHGAFVKLSKISAKAVPFDLWNIRTPRGASNISVFATFEGGHYRFSAHSSEDGKQRTWTETDPNRLRRSVLQDLSVDTRSLEGSVESVEKFLEAGQNPSLSIENGNGQHSYPTYAAYALDVLQKEVGLYASIEDFLEGLNDKANKAMRRGIIMDEREGHAPVILLLFRDRTAIALAGDKVGPFSDAKVHLIPACFQVELESSTNLKIPYKCSIRVNKSHAPEHNDLCFELSRFGRKERLNLPLKAEDLPEGIKEVVDEAFQGIRTTFAFMWSLPPIKRPSEEGVDAGTVTLVDPVGIWTDENGLQFYWPRALSQRTCRLDIMEPHRQVVQDIVDLALWSDPHMPEGYTVTVTGHSFPDTEDSDFYRAGCVEAPLNEEHYPAMAVIFELRDQIAGRLPDLELAHAFKTACDGVSASHQDTPLLTITGRRPDQFRGCELIEKYGHLFADAEAKLQKIRQRAFSRQRRAA